jgi:hypothetical protein
MMKTEFISVNLLDPFERRMILEDQDTVLRSNHFRGHYKVCADLAKCPADHFGLLPSEVKTRQSIIKKLEKQ